MRLQSEVTVHQAGVETEVLQPCLQRRDIVAVHRRAELMVESACTKAIRSLFQRTVSRFTDDAVDEQSPVLLESAHGMVEVVVEHIHSDVLTSGQVRIRAVDQPQRRQGGPDLGDRTPAVTATQTRHTRPFGRLSAVIPR